MVGLSLDLSTGDPPSVGYNLEGVLVEPANETSESANKGAIIISGFQQTFEEGSEAGLVRHMRKFASVGYHVFAPNATTALVTRAEQLIFRGLYNYLGRELKLPAQRTVLVSFSQDAGTTEPASNSSKVDISMASKLGASMVKQHDMACATMDTCNSLVENALRAIPDTSALRSYRKTELQVFLDDLFSWSRLSTGILVSSFAMVVRLLIAIRGWTAAFCRWRRKRGQFQGLSKGCTACKCRRRDNTASHSSGASAQRQGASTQRSCSLWRICFCWWCHCFRCHSKTKSDDGAEPKTCILYVSQILVKYPKRWLWTVLALLVVPSVAGLVTSVLGGKLNIDLVSEASFKITGGKVSGCRRTQIEMHLLERTHGVHT